MLLEVISGGTLSPTQGQALLESTALIDAAMHGEDVARGRFAR
jgi:hypothetical protein